MYKIRYNPTRQQIKEIFSQGAELQGVKLYEKSYAYRWKLGKDNACRFAMIEVDPQHFCTIKQPFNVHLEGEMKRLLIIYVSP